MDGLLWSDEPYGLFTFVLITLVLGGLGAWATGRAMAQTWRPLAMLALYMVFLTAGVQVPPLCALRRAVAVAGALHKRLCLDDGRRRGRISGDARDPDGDAIFLGL